MEYWKCSKTGIALPMVDKKEPDCKFVIAESLPEQGSTAAPIFGGISAMFDVISASAILSTFIPGRNQVDTFLENHRTPGIQHIGLNTNDIVSTAQTMAEAGVQFFSPPFTYYTEV